MIKRTEAPNEVRYGGKRSAMWLNFTPPLHDRVELKFIVPYGSYATGTLAPNYGGTLCELVIGGRVGIRL